MRILNPKIRTFLEANGLKKNVSEAEVRGAYEAWKLRGITPTDPLDIEVQDDPADPAGGGTPPPDTPSSDPAAEMKAEQARIDMIEMYLRSFPEAAPLRGMLVADKTYAGGRIAKAVGDYVAVRANGLMPGNIGGAGGVQLGEEGVDRMRAAMVDGLLLRQGRMPAEMDRVTGQPVQQRKYADGAEKFRNMSMKRMYEELLRQHGVDTSSMSDMDIVSRMLVRAPQTSADFPNLLAAYLNKSLISIAASANRDWLPVVKVVAANDFRTRHAIQFGGNNEFDVMKEGGEFPLAYFKESKESYEVEPMGLKAILTLQIIMHDDLGAFDAQPAMMMSAMVAAERRKVFAALQSPAVMSDGKTLFHADHGNVSTVDATRGDFESIKAALRAMRVRFGKQKTITGIKTSVIPKNIICTFEDADDLFALCAEPRVASQANPIGANNLNFGMGVIAADELAVSPIYFYAFGDPNLHPVLEAAWFQGNQGVNFFSEPEFGNMGVKYLGWTGFGVGRVGYHGVDRTTIVLPA